MNPLDDMRSNCIEKICLDSSIRLGTLYDCYRDKPIPGIKLWDQKKLKENRGIASESRESSSFKSISVDSFPRKASNLNIDASLKLSLIGGLVEASGAAKYLKDRKSSKRQWCFTAKFESISVYEELQPQKVQYADEVNKTPATHVVVGVLYGADAFLVFDGKLESEKGMKNVRGRLEALVHGLNALCSTLRTPEGHVGLDKQDDDEKDAEDIRCICYGDLELPNDPISYREGEALLKELPGKLNGKGVPKKIFLLPLSYLHGCAERIVNEVSVSLVSQVEVHMEKLLDYELRCNDLMDTKVCSSFSKLHSQLKDFKEIILDHKKGFQAKLRDLVPKIRNGEMEESRLEDLVKPKKASPFRHEYLTAWLEYKVQEIKILERYVELLKEFGHIVSTYGLTGCILDHTLEQHQVVCFSFNVASSEDQYLELMKSYKQEQDPRVTSKQNQDPMVTSWTDDIELMNELTSLITQRFVPFAKANKEKERIKFVVTECANKESDSRPAILLYEGFSTKKFYPPLKPHNVKAVSHVVTDCSVTVEWSRPQCGSESVESYEVCYRQNSDPESEWKTEKTKGNETHMKVGGLQPDTEYCFKVRAECEVGFSQYSEVSLPVRTKIKESSVDRLAVRLRSTFKEIPHDGSDKSPLLPSVYELASRDRVKEEKVSDRMLRRVVIGDPSLGVEEKVLMIVGATGAGKTTLINGMINYILGVRWTDDFRFKLIIEEGLKSQAHSQTRTITAYTIHHMEGSKIPYTLTVIDTPGFGDTSGLERDREITQQIKTFFSVGSDEGISHLDGIGFVTQSFQSRLTPMLMYIFDSMQSIFGKDIVDNIFIMATFADIGPVLVMDAVKAAGVPFSGYFKFNNSSLFGASRGRFSELFWKMGVHSFEEFFTSFQNVKSVSLTMTKEVLEERDRLHSIIGGIQRQVKMCFEEMDVLRQEELILQDHQAQIATNENFTYQTEVPYYHKVELKSDEYATNCLDCQMTCHFPCSVRDDDKKWQCAVMNENSKESACCRVCKGNCHWRRHRTASERFELRHKKEIRTNEDLKKKFYTAGSQKSVFKDMIDKQKLQLQEAHVELHILVEEARKCLERLEEIALRPKRITQVEYLQLLIASEKARGRKGWLERVKYLETTKKQAEMLAACKGTENIEDKIKTEKQEKKSGWEERVEALEEVKEIKVEIDAKKAKVRGSGEASARFKDGNKSPAEVIVGTTKQPESTTSTAHLEPSSKPVMKEAFEALKPLGSQWQSLGIELEIPNSTLERIRYETQGAMDCLREVVRTWLTEEPSPSWSKLATAVRDIDPMIAGTIEMQYGDS